MIISGGTGTGVLVRQDTPTLITPAITTSITIGASGILVGGTNVLEQRNAANAQEWRLYNTFTDASNYERLKVLFATNVARIGVAVLGTGVARVLVLDYGGTSTAAISIPITSGQITFGGGLTIPGGTLLTTNTALTNGAAAATGTLTNAPAAGNPTKWVPVSDNGVTRYIPMW